MVHEVENFYGVYLLYNINPKFKGRTYIGFTVDPNRRVKQHNTGKHAGGAWRTSGKGPWEMVVITHGFPNEISALRFEWAWQNPVKSRRLRHLAKKSRKESAYEYRFRILTEMLRTGPWNRLALTVRWLKQEYQRDFPPQSAPPLHVAVAYGPVKAVKVKGAPSRQKKTAQTSELTSSDDNIERDDVEENPQTQLVGKRCHICNKDIDEPKICVRCYHPACTMVSHMICLSQVFLRGEGAGHVLPVGGPCPACHQELLWGDIIRHKQGCFLKPAEEVSLDLHWANELNADEIL